MGPANPVSGTDARRCGLGAALALAILLVAAMAARGTAEDPKEASAATRRFAVAVGFQSRKLPKLAIEEWRKFVTEFPKDPRLDRARHNLGVCLLQDGQFDAAIAELKGVIAAYPQYGQIDTVTLNLGVAQLRRAGQTKQAADFDAATQTFAAILKKSPQGLQAPRAVLYQAEALALAGKSADAAATYAKLIQAYPQSDLVPDATYALGLTQDEMKQPEQAGATFAGFLQKFPKHTLADECRVRQAEALFVQKKYAEAEALFSLAATATGFAYSDFALLRQAACLYGRGQFVEAAALDQSLPQKFPKSKLVGAARLAAGKSLFQADKPGPARDALAPVIREKLPEGAEAAYWTGRAFLKEKNANQALGTLEAALAAYPDSPARALLEFGRADALAEIPPRRAEAVASYAEFARKHPGDPQAAQALYLASFTALSIDQFDVAKAHAASFATAFPSHSLLPEVRFVAAEAELRARRWPEAATLYQEFLRQWPQSPHAEEAKVRRGLALSMQKKYDDVIGSLSPELSSFKNKEWLANAYYLIGRARADQGQHEPAIAAMNAALSAKPDWTQADETLLALAHCHRARNEMGEAVTILTKLVGSFPKSPVAASALYLLAECEAAQDKLDQALAHYREAASVASEETTASLARFGIGRILYRKSDWNGAVEALTALVQKYPKSDVLPHALYARALARRKLKQDAQAIEDVKTFLASKPTGDEALDARLVLGLCQSSIGQHQAAHDTLAALAKEQPNSRQIDQIRYELAFTLTELKRDKEAAEAFRQLAAASPASPLAAEGLFRVGEFHYGSSQYDDAARAYNEALTKSPASALKERALHKLAWCAFKREDFSAAAAAFDRQVTEVPAGALVQDGLFLAAESEFKQGKHAAAYDRYLKIARAKPPSYHARALYRAGQCAGLLKNWSASAGHYEELLSSFPKFDRRADARYGLGLALQNQDQLAPALAAYEQVVKETDTETAAKAQFMIGECLFAQKKHEEAAAEFLKAAYGYPYEEWVGNAHFEAARCFEILEKLDQARQSYQILAEKFPNHPKAKVAGERLRDLKDVTP
ncbi:MAG: Tetratricopeptide 2 repeat protein [Planctomycetota bacterium]|nr:Tetratricopeptide 2 repeat protein [Planctomycetota bacterium]